MVMIRPTLTAANFNPRSSYEERLSPGLFGQQRYNFNPRSSYEERPVSKR